MDLKKNKINMNILFITDGYPSKNLPYSAFIGVLCEELTRQRCDISVIAPQSYTKHLLRGTPLAPKMFSIPVDTEFGQRVINVLRPYSFTFGEGVLGKLTLKMNQWVSDRCVKKINAKPDIVYAHFWKSAYNALNLVMKKGIPLIVASGEDKIDIHKILTPDEIRRIRENTTGCICVSSKNKEESIGIGIIDEEKISVIPNSINPKEFYLKDKKECRRKLGFSESDFIVAFCGRFNQRKGAMRVADAINQLGDPQIKSIFIGSVADNETVQPECEGILFRGALPHTDIVKYLNCADVFVLPSLAEGCPNSVIEAMACGLPIISSDLPFNYDILDSSNSILVNPMNVQEIADAIAKLKYDEPLRLNLREGALKKASELTIEKRVTKILKFIRERCKQVE